jgi:proline iminopeptidase
LHGGPGSASRDKHKNNFDPTKQRVIFHDQRGCGRSLPYGSLKNNTTKDLVDDISKIADKLGIKSFIITGSSWGSCLAFAYAIAHPERVNAMALSGIFTGSHSEVDWLDKGRFQTFYPDVWQRYLDATPNEHHDDPSAYHFERILGDDEQAIKQSGLAYDSLEGAVAMLDDRFTPDDPETYDPAGIRLEVYYMANKCFMPDKYIIDNAHKITMPVWLIQGRYDMVCPPTTAYELSKKIPTSQLVWSVSGHGSSHETWNLVRTVLLQLSS